MQAMGMPIVDVGQLVAEKFQAAIETRWLGAEVEAYITAVLKNSSRKWPELVTPIVVINNIGILFEPNLAINPAIWLKRQAKELTIILLWLGQFQSPGLFYWPNSPKHHTLNLTDAAPQQLIITE